MSLEQEYKDKIIALISAMMPDVNIYLFGSRARKVHTERSDIDIALKGKEKLDRYAVGEIRSVLEATNIPYTVDVVDYYGVNADMREMIDKEGILWK